MGHQNGLTDSVTGTTASAAYGTTGEIDSMSLGGISESFAYNSLWQLTGMSATENVYPFTLLSMQYVYPAGHNNGRISSSTDSVLGETVNYGYDSLNRLSTAQATNGAWGQSYTYDGFGNLIAKTVTAGSAMQFSASYNAANNQQSGLSYDANGNALSGPYGVGYTYDVENRITANGNSVYGYDPQNQRVMVQTAGGAAPQILINSLFTFYSVTGQMLSTFSINSSSNSLACANDVAICASGPTPGYLYLAGKRLMVADRLGSQRGNGQAYYPWGEPINSPAPTGDVEFATYWRDMVGQDYADQRYYNSNAGRFYTPDPSGKKAVTLRNPTSWNMYAYVNDDPVNFNDPRGLLIQEEPDEYGVGDDSWFGNDSCTVNGLVDAPGPLCGYAGPSVPFPYTDTYEDDQPCSFTPETLLEYMQNVPAYTAQGRPSSKPLATLGYAEDIFADAIADNVDPRLLVAISFVESKWGRGFAGLAH